MEGGDRELTRAIVCTLLCLKKMNNSSIQGPNVIKGLKEGRRRVYRRRSAKGKGKVTVKYSKTSHPVIPSTGNISPIEPRLQYPLRSRRHFGVLPSLGQNKSDLDSQMSPSSMSCDGCQP